MTIFDLLKLGISEEQFFWLVRVSSEIAAAGLLEVPSSPQARNTSSLPFTPAGSAPPQAPPPSFLKEVAKCES